MAKRITAYKARTHFGELLNEVFYRGNTVVITRRGKTTAILSPPLPSRAAGRKRLRNLRKGVIPLYGALKGRDGAIIARVVRESRREPPSEPPSFDE